ncbi:hypothetical protein CROQUDRAFT_82977 [Cronartium quercuum f. sp. fusiforme G11]|uniref:Peroxisomal membrane protein PEX14-like KPWE domain-containing protein n=1 Tax=Cronartium quercuum f. sp. fusiforme G11 TaxID=708437 RepID=A0A9P6NCX3_9BASI|nr:hypothetical protein CROQUDRAFT_82977 [Cronartium quercuum f. sp. fusiforme G11]
MSVNLNETCPSSSHDDEIRTDLEPNKADIFQSGLENIVQAYETKLGRRLTDEELQTVTNQAREFFSKSETESQQGSHSSMNSLPNTEKRTTSKDPSPPYPSTFAALVELITSGATLDEHTVAGFKRIPNQLNSQNPSQATIATQKGAGQKPWQTHSSAI